MAISQLVSVGYQKDANSPVRRAYHRTDKDKAQRVEKVSSNMFTESFLNSVIDMLRGFNTDIAKLHESAKKTLMSLAKLVKSVKELNKDITSRFKALNTDLNASKLDFVRNVLTAPAVLPDGSIGTLAEAQKQAKDTPEKQEEGGGILDYLLDFLPDRGKGAARGARAGARAGLKRGLYGLLIGAIGGAALGAAGVETDPDKLKDEGTRKGYLEIVSKKLDEVKYPNKEKLLWALQTLDTKEQAVLVPFHFGLFASKTKVEEGIKKLEAIADARGVGPMKLDQVPAAASTPQQPPVSYQQAGVGFSAQQTPGGTSERRPIPSTPGGGHTEGQKTGAPQAAASGGNAAPPIPQPPQRDRGQTVSTAGMESPSGTAMSDASGVDAYKDSSITAAPTPSGVVQGSPDSMPATQKDVDAAIERAVKNTANAPFPTQIPGEVDAYLDKKAIPTVPPPPPEEPKLDATISSEPIVINNNEVNSTQSTSGGTNFVTGQNFPMSAHNPYLQEFIARQNIQYT